MSWSRVRVGTLHVAYQLLADRIEQADPHAVVRGGLLHRDIRDPALATTTAEQRLLGLDAQQRKIVRQDRQRRNLEARVGEVGGEERIELQTLDRYTAAPPCEQLTLEVVPPLGNRAVREHLLERCDGCRIRIALESGVPHGHVVGDVLALGSEGDTDHVAGSRVAVNHGAHRHRSGCADPLYRVVGLMRIDDDLDFRRRRLQVAGQRSGFARRRNICRHRTVVQRASRQPREQTAKLQAVEQLSYIALVVVEEACVLERQVDIDVNLDGRRPFAQPRLLHMAFQCALHAAGRHGRDCGKDILERPVLLHQ